jgi:ABC-2 type transport system ATP-binding protein
MIRTSGLVKRYGDVVALAGLDLEVEKGTVLGLLGPNGAGKTTAVRILTTLLNADEGTAEVAGIDVAKEPGKVRERIGLSGQNAAVDEYLTGFENLDMVGRLYHLPKEESRARARDLLVRFELDEAADRPAKTYSGGMRRRLDLAAALVINPDVIFLDEPTTGLDPRSRVNMWKTIQDLVKKGGSTALLTTQYMEEADRLADNIVVIDRGKMIAQGTPDDLKTQIGGEQIEVVLSNPADVPSSETILKGLSVGDVQVDDQTHKISAPVTGGVEVLKQVLRQFEDQSIKIVDIGLHRPTLDDVFLSLTGHTAEEVAETSDGKKGDGQKADGQKGDGAAAGAEDREKEAVR